ncbi:SNF2 family N-terminal domain-containing protein [Fusarium flagelliforme]|uniref:SNF2 family N-terminal domain-containing protein n=1 Tax=Fusarium flagelliforme TaxID=2675880 RepID=UPI001E8DE020|nr:SNF2 family N-terminal domain-containing protein [Fusarium flagelliforme]KAH7182523.1 SNF2 family N-terminal domain-containing protein [Fusarium flagelliforme]
MNSTASPGPLDTEGDNSQHQPEIKIEDPPTLPMECTPAREEEDEEEDEEDVPMEDAAFLLQKSAPPVLPVSGTSKVATRPVGLRPSPKTTQVDEPLNTTAEEQGQHFVEDSAAEDSADEVQDKLDSKDPDFKPDDQPDLDSGINEVTIKKEEPSADKLNNTPEAETKRKCVKTAREYWQRELRREREAEEKKRKLSEDNKGPQKARKTSAKSTAGDARNLASLMASSLHKMNDLKESIAKGSVPSMGSIQASTKRDAIKQMINSAPEGCDTRHTKAQKAELKEAMVSFGYANVESANGKWRLSGISERLQSHQLTAAQWMVKKEAKELQPAGGILADDTGMGKTVSTLACIVSHPAEKEDVAEYSKATLIVVPNRSMITQWENQIEKFCYYKEKENTHRFSKHKTAKWHGNQWVIFTTYSELVSQYPSTGTIHRLKDKYKDDKKGFAKALNSSYGTLFQVRWYRIILDEGQAIKNRESSTALACWNLTAKYRWVLTATPISNSIEELYPYMKFIGCNFTRSLSEFKDQYMTGENAAQNIRFIVSVIMLRRTHEDTFIGRKITNLPPHECHDLWVTPSNWELALFRVVENQSEFKLLKTQGDDENDAGKDAEKDAASSEDTDVKIDSKSMTAQCTRMRQAASHPFNLEGFLQERNRKDNIAWILEQCKKDASEITLTPEQRVDDAIQWSPFLPGLQEIETKYQNVPGDETDMEKLLELVNNEHSASEMICCLCEDPVELKRAVRGTNCEHVYCVGCLKSNLKNARKRQPEGTPDQCPADDCSVELVTRSPYKTPECIRNAVRSLKDFKEPGTDSIGSQWLSDSKGTDCFFAATSGREDISFDPVRMPWGAKLTGIMQVILTWLKKSPTDKIIVFIEFTITAKALGCILEKMGLGFLYYNQIATTQTKKDKAVKEFQETPEIRILVASMKCGGTGLNLQIANLVLIGDLWYNLTLELQAFGRVHRIGQNKKTTLIRILARGTIDESLIQLQEAKAAVVERVLGDDKPEPIFSNDLQLRMLFSGKDKNAMIDDMEKEARKRKGRAKKTTGQASGAKTAGKKSANSKAKKT